MYIFLLPFDVSPAIPVAFYDWEEERVYMYVRVNVCLHLCSVYACDVFKDGI